MVTISSNTLVLNEKNNIDGLIRNLLDAKIDEMIFLDGGLTDGSFELLKQYENNYNNIIVLSWKQPNNSEYRLGFNESKRRNIMKDVSKSDYILYIDADERVSLNIKERINKDYDFIALSRMHFWDNKLRVNTQNDLVWPPEVQYRIFRNTNKLKFKSNDLHGLHNFVTFRGTRLFGGFNNQKMYKRIFILILNKILFIKTKIVENSYIYHLHYLDLSKGLKKNDLRANDIKDGLNILVDNLNDGLNYDYKIKNYVCLMNEFGNFLEIEKYI